MYFFSHHTRLYSFAAPIKPFYRYLLTFIILATVMYGWLYGLYFPVQQVIELHTHEIKELENQRITLKKEQKSQKELDQSLLELESMHHSFVRTSKEQTIDSKISSILNYAQESGLALRSFSTQKELDKQWYIKEIMQSNFAGTLEQALDFFNRIATSQGMVQCKDVELILGQENTYSINCTLHITLLQ